MLQDIGTNILSELILIGLGIILASLFYLLTKRKQLLRFFGIEKNRRIIIYLSKLDVLFGGATGIDRLPRSFQGKALANEEAKAANQLQSLFNYFLPSWGKKPGILDKLLIADIDVQVVISPSNINEVEQSASFITLGSYAYNAASKFIDMRKDALGRFDLVSTSDILPPNSEDRNNPTMTSASPGMASSSDLQIGGTVAPIGWSTEALPEQVQQNGPMPSGTSIRIPPIFPQSSQPAIIIEGIPPITDTRMGYLERIYDQKKQRTLFCAAGISELATAGAAYYLKSKWQELNKKYGDTKSFLILLRFDSSDYRQPIVISEKSE